MSHRKGHKDKQWFTKYYKEKWTFRLHEPNQNPWIYQLCCFDWKRSVTDSRLNRMKPYSLFKSTDKQHNDQRKRTKKPPTKHYTKK
jgi:hypothetical protein